MTFRIVIIYTIGFVSLAYGFYEFWRDTLVDQNAFLIGGTCLGAAAMVQVVRDLWSRIRR